jgi:hypothetical protein
MQRFELGARWEAWRGAMEVAKGRGWIVAARGGQPRYWLLSHVDPSAAARQLC